MARVLMVWELGSGMGHIDRMLVSARALRQRGHEVRFALKDLSRAHQRVAAEGFMMMQAPVWLPKMANPPRLGNFSAVLASAGWLNANGLAALIIGWRNLIELNQPDAIICDHAPTAILATRGLGVPTLAVGNSFEVPPLEAHFPAMAHWNVNEAAHCAAYDAHLLAPANEALALLGLDPLPRLTAMFEHVHQALVSIPELTHYPHYPEGMPILGPAFVEDIGLAPKWPSADAPMKAFAYVAPTYGGFEALMSAIRTSGMCTLIHAKGISASAIGRLQGPNMRFEANAVRMGETLNQAQLVISHASVGTVSAAALAGKVQLGLPQHMEQEMVGRRLVEAGVGLVVPLGTSVPNFSQMLNRLTSETSFASAARKLAEKNAALSSSLTGIRVADMVDAVLLRH